MSRSRFFICLIGFAMTACAHAQPANTYLQKLRTVQSAKEFEQITAGKVQIQRSLDPQQQIALRLAIMRWPNTDFTVIAVGFDDNSIWIETPKGFSRIEYKPMTLADKSKVFVERIQKRHNRWGQTSDSHLRVAGDLSTNQMVSSDNDGLWTSIYVAAECFRYKVTGAADARDNARRGMQAILRLEAITGIPGFPARSFIKVGEDVQPGDGEWH